MPETGYTIEPLLTVDPATGQEFLSYDHAHVEDHGEKLQQIDEFQHGQQFYQNTAGDVRNIYADAPDQIVEDDPTLHLTDEAEEQAMDWVESAFTYQTYAEMIQWASDNLETEMIMNYNDIIESNNINDIKEAATALYNFYMLNLENN